MILAIFKIHNNDLQISLSIGVYAGIYIAQNYEVCHTSDKIKGCFYDWLLDLITMEYKYKLLSVLSSSCVWYKILDTISTLQYLEADLIFYII